MNGLPVDDQIRRLTEDRSPRTSPVSRTIRNHNIDTKISVLWLFYCKNRGVLPFFIGFKAKMLACLDVFRPRKPFLFLAV